MDLDYKNCKYFKEAEEKEHCPFSSVCKDNCIFTLMRVIEDHENHTEIEVDTDEEEEYREYKSYLKDYLRNVLRKLSKYEVVPLIGTFTDEFVDINIMINRINEERKDVE